MATTPVPSKAFVPLPEDAVPDDVPGIIGTFNYQSPETEHSLLATGRVGVMRDAAGSDAGATGMHPGAAHQLHVRDARQTGASLDEEGAELVEHAWGHPIDYYDEEAVLKVYYDECARLVKARTGARHVLAFDHNIRCRSKAKAKVMLNGGNQVQVPAGGTHADYSVTSAPNRVRNLAKPLGINDTLRGLCKYLACGRIALARQRKC
jgi:hypothetical protein